MKISCALNSRKKILREKNIESFALDALILLCHATSFSKEKIIFNPDIILDEESCKTFENMVARRFNREPISHIIGKREFFGYDFIVSNKTLDPRPDSESLIELVIKNFPDKNKNFNILEIGVGTGCLIISLLKNFVNATGEGVDISLDALNICQRNLENHNLQNRLQIFQSDLFAKIAISQKFDLIISNPPYIKSADIQTLQDEVRLHEPILALDGGVDGLDFYRKIADEAGNFLVSNGKIILEIGFGQKQDVERIFVNNGFAVQEVAKDLAGVERLFVFGSADKTRSVLNE